MWAHYADQHRGLCLEFDADHPFFDRRAGPEDLYRHLEKVRYSDDRPNLRFEDYLGLTSFLTKSRAWEYEQEWRMVVPFDEPHRAISVPGGDVHLFDLPPDCVSGVILGCRMGDATRRGITDALRADARYRHLEIRQVQLDGSKFALNVCDIAYHHYYAGLEHLARASRYQEADPQKSAEFARMAMPELDRAIELDPTRSEAYLARWSAYRSFLPDDPASRDFQETQERALREVGEAMELEPLNEELHARRGRVHLALGEVEAALQDFQVAIDLVPTDLQGLYVQVGRIHWALGGTAAAFREFRVAADLGHPTAGREVDKLRDQLEDQRPGGPRGLLERVADMEQATAASDWDAVIEAGESALRLDGAEPSALRRTAHAYKQRGYQAHGGAEPLRAIADYSRSIELVPDDYDTYLRGA
jgi:tetratricopeptide (TPR) repeat protein